MGRLLICICLGPSLAAAQHVVDASTMIRLLPCEEFLTDEFFAKVDGAVEITAESRRLESALVQGTFDHVLRLRQQTGADPAVESSDSSYGNGFLRAWADLEAREIRDSTQFEPPFVGDHFPHREAVVMLSRRVRKMARALRTVDELEAVARVTAALLADTLRAAREGRRYMLATARNLRSVHAGENGVDLIKAVLLDFNARFNEGQRGIAPVPAAVLARLDDPGAREVLAEGLNFASRVFAVERRAIARGASEEALYILREVTALRLRNDWRLILMEPGPVDAASLLDVRRQILRAWPRLKLDQREALVAEVTVSPAFRTVLREASERFGPESFTPEEFAIRRNRREARQKELLYYLAFMHPEFFVRLDEAYRLQREAVRATMPSKLRNPVAVKDAARAASRRGNVQFKSFRRWLDYVQLGDWNR